MSTSNSKFIHFQQYMDYTYTKSVYKSSSNVDSQNRNKRAVKDERNI